MTSRTPRTHPALTTTPRPTAPNGGGRALDGDTNARMSAQFGHDFSSVRIHTDTRAEESAGALGANAYAQGRDIVFGGGAYAPGSPQTDRLLAHELTHVVQQSRSGPGDPGRISQGSDSSEQEADSLASQVMLGRSVQVRSAPGAAIARDPAPDLGVDPASVSSRQDAPTSYPGDTDAPPTYGPPAPSAVPVPDPAQNSSGGPGGIPQLSTPVNDVLGTALGYGGLVPGPVGTAFTLAGGLQTATQGPTDKTDPQYSTDRTMQGLGLGLTGASLLGLEAAGPLGLVATAGMALGHGAQALGNEMIESGMQNNPGQFGPDPMDGLGQ